VTPFITPVPVTPILIPPILIPPILIPAILIPPILDPDRIDRCRGTAAAAGNWSASPPRGVGAPSRARSTS